MTKLNLYKNILLGSFVCLTINCSNADVMCLNGQEPTKGAILQAEQALKKSENELSHLAHKLAKHPESVEHKEHFAKKTDLIVQKAVETKYAWDDHKLPKDLTKCAESNLDDKSFNLLLKKWDRIIACFPNNNDYIYNQKLLHVIQNKVRKSDIKMK